MLRTLRMVNALLSAHERRRAVQVFVLMLFMALVETLGVASVMPFVAVLSKPEIIHESYYLSLIYNSLGFDDPKFFLFLLGISALAVFLAGLALRAVTTYAVVRFSTMRLHTISFRLLTAYLNQPYSFFLGRNTADLGKSVLSEVGKVTNGVILPLLRVFSGVIVVLAILILLLLIEPKVSFIVAAVLGGAFSCIYAVTRRLLLRVGKDRVQANQLRFVLANEALSGIKELRLMGRENVYLHRFRSPSERYARHQATNRTVSELPQYGIQAVVFGGALAAVLYLTTIHGGIDSALPLISLYAIAGYRLLPAFQLIFGNLAKMRFSLPALEALYDDLTLKEMNTGSCLKREKNSIVRLNGSVQLENVGFHYPSVSRAALKEVNLIIPRGTSAAFVGSTGAGKSTVVDLILGLLEPTEGRILVDGQPLVGSRLRGWQRNIGYVPQTTYLADDTIAANIAFGIPEKQIRFSEVEQAARAAHIHDFVVKELPDGYETIVGERGIRLSGGQRQRLAIARALYHDPEVVVFDEATSALDNVTEAIVMEAIEELRGNKTVIIIAHRFSTIQKCDQVYVLQNGRISGNGSYSELLESNTLFKNLVQARQT